MAAGSRRELLEIEESQIRQRVALQIAPDVLDRVELGRIGRKELGRELAVRGEEVLDEVRAVSIEPVPDENDGRVDLGEELPEKVDDTLRVDVGVRMEAKVETDVASIGGHAQRPDDGHLAMGAPQWRSNGVSPRGFHVRRMSGAIIRPLSSMNASQACRRHAFFSIRGQSSRTHPRMRSSLRSRARR